MCTDCNCPYADPASQRNLLNNTWRRTFAFNIKKINVQGNSKINTEEIESLSKINMNENIFRFSSRQIEKNVKKIQNSG